MKFREKMADFLEGLARYLRPEPCVDDTSQEGLFAPLTPVLDLDHFQQYASAFETIEHQDVSCIAVTGPYGSGKSSILRAYKAKKPNLRFIEISLANFEEEISSGNAKSRSDAIEKSILQQLIYSVARSDLPYSRFKKINPPANPRIKSAGITLFAALTFSAALFQSEIKTILSDSQYWWQHWLLGGSLIIWLTGLYLLVLTVYQGSVGLSLKRLSLKNGEIETNNENEQSVFNRHLDEILYFFQEAECDVVLIEDLDRFEDNTEIFTKIREVNTLINQNETIKRQRSSPIKFVFAVKDDLFKEKNRTKFFDLIIPVIPYASSSNAYALLCNNLRCAKLLRGMNKSILRNLAVHMNDNRLLTNTLNEYRLYASILTEGNLDPTRLFATVVYKNFFPTDFCKLHDQDGVFATLIERYEFERENLKTSIEREAKDLQEAEEAFSKKELKSRQAIASAYWGATLRHYKLASVHSIRGKVGAQTLTVESSVDDLLDFFGNQKSFTLKGSDRQNRSQHLEVHTTSVADLVHPGTELEELLEQIDSQKNDQVRDGELRTLEIQNELRQLNFKSLANTISESSLEDLARKTNNPNLFTYLIRNDLLGRDFADYMNYFHDGAMTQEDRLFCQQFDRPEIGSSSKGIDNPSEVIETLGDRLFQKERGYNVTILDYILSNSERTKQYLGLLKEGFRHLNQDLFPRLSDYFSDGESPNTLLDLIWEHWPDYFKTLSRSREHFVRHSQAVLLWISRDKARILREQVAWLAKLQDQAAKVFTPTVTKSAIEILPEIGVKIRDLSFPLLSKTERKHLFAVIINNEQWKINRGNFLAILLHSNVTEKEALEQPITSLLGLQNPRIANYLFKHSNLLVERCFLQIKESVYETVEGLEKLLNLQDLEIGTVSAIVERQKVSLRFEAVLPSYWETLIEFEKIEFSWENIDFFAESRPEDDPFSEQETSPYELLLSTRLSSELAKDLKPVGDQLRWAVFSNDDLEDTVYFKLARKTLGELDSLPQPLSLAKRRHLTTQGLVELSEESMNWAGEDPEIISALISIHRDEYFEDPEIYEEHLTNAVITHLLATDISQAQKRVLCSEIETDAIEIDLIRAIQSVVKLAEPPFDFLDDEMIRSIVSSRVDPQFCATLIGSRLNEWSHGEIMTVLGSSPPPLDKISEYGKRPKLPDQPEFLQLLQRLRKAGHISSFKKLDKGEMFQVYNRKSPLS